MWKQWHCYKCCVACIPNYCWSLLTSLFFRRLFWVRAGLPKGFHSSGELVDIGEAGWCLGDVLITLLINCSLYQHVLKVIVIGAVWHCYVARSAIQLDCWSLFQPFSVCAFVIFTAEFFVYISALLCVCFCDSVKLQCKFLVVISLCCVCTEMPCIGILWLTAALLVQYVTTLLWLCFEHNACVTMSGIILVWMSIPRNFEVLTTLTMQSSMNYFVMWVPSWDKLTFSSGPCSNDDYLGHSKNHDWLIDWSVMYE